MSKETRKVNQMNKKIEDMTLDEIRTQANSTDDMEELGDLRLRCIQMYDKYFAKSSSSPPDTRGHLLAKYAVVAERIHKLGKPVSARSKLDQTLMRKSMLGVDVSSLEPVMLIEGAVSIFGAHAINPRGAEEAEVVVDKACEPFADQLRFVAESLLEHLGKPVLMGLDDVEGSIVPLYDLMIVPCEKTRRIVRENTTDIMKPYPNEHAARQNPTSKYTKFRRQNNKFGAGIHVIFGITSDGKSEVQAIRFDKTKFTPEQARAWLKEHDYKTTLEVAAKKFADVMLRPVLIVKDDDAKDEHIVGGIVYDADIVDFQDDYTDAEEITKMMHDFMENSQTFQRMHKAGRKDVLILECFQAEVDTKKGGEKLPKGSWWITVRVNDKTLWKEIKEGKITGFSMGGKAEVAE